MSWGVREGVIPGEAGVSPSTEWGLLVGDKYLSHPCHCARESRRLGSGLRAGVSACPPVTGGLALRQAWGTSFWGLPATATEGGGPGLWSQLCPGTTPCSLGPWMREYTCWAWGDVTSPWEEGGEGAGWVGSGEEREASRGAHFLPAWVND